MVAKLLTVHYGELEFELTPMAMFTLKNLRQLAPDLEVIGYRNGVQHVTKLIDIFIPGSVSGTFKTPVE